MDRMYFGFLVVGLYLIAYSLIRKKAWKKSQPNCFSEFIFNGIALLIVAGLAYLNIFKF